MDSEEKREEAVSQRARHIPRLAEHDTHPEEASATEPLRQRLEVRLQAFQHETVPAGTATPISTDACVPAPGESRSDETVGERIGHYRLLQVIGKGGMGMVYLAEQEEPIRRRVALKVIKLGVDTEQAIARFAAERQALALMDHPNIARLFDAGATRGGKPFFVMELVRGEPITDYCDRVRLPPAERLDLFMHVCHAVQHAHEKGIIHRDLKPSNILVTEYDGKPIPKVIDFGVAKAVTGPPLTDQTLVTAHGQPVGTLAYMSPEQTGLSGLGLDTRSDIYSLGVVLYELLTSKTPIDKEELKHTTQAEACRLIREKEPPRPSTRLSTLADQDLSTAAQHRGCEPPELVRLVRGGLDWIVMKCLEKERTRRYGNAASLAADLHHYLRHEPVSARAPSLPERLAKLVRRHRAPLVGTGLSLLGASMLATIFVIGYRKPPPRSVGEPPPFPAHASVPSNTSKTALVLARKLSHPEVSTWGDALLGDFDGDGESDVFVTARNKVVVMDLVGGTSKTSPEFWGQRFEGLSIDLVTDLNGDSKEELFLSWRENLTNLAVAVYNQNFFPLKTFHETGSVVELETGLAGDSGLRVLQTIGGHDGVQTKVIAKIGTCYALKPRGILCFDQGTGSLSWAYYVAPHVGKTLTADFNQDGVTDILFGTQSPCNGNKLDDATDDSHSYLYALSGRGRGDLLWRSTTGDEFTSCEPLMADLDGTGTNSILVKVATGHHLRQEVGKVIKYDFQGKVLAHYDAGTDLLSLGVVRLGGDRRPQVLATDRLGRLHVLDSQLRRTRPLIEVAHPRFQSTNDWCAFYLDAATDLNADGEQELVFRSSQVRFISGLNAGQPQADSQVTFWDDNQVLVLSSKLQPLASYLVAERWKWPSGFRILVPRLRRERQSLLVLGQEALLLEFVAARTK